MTRVKKGFYDKRRSGLIICQHEIYLHSKSGHSRMKNEGVMAKILFKCGGGANRVKEGFHHMRYLGLIIWQYEIYLPAKSGYSSMKNEGVMAKILFNYGSANRVKVGFHQGGCI